METILNTLIYIWIFANLIIITVLMIWLMIPDKTIETEIEKDPPVLTPEELAIRDFEKENRERLYKIRYEKKKKELEEEYFKQNKTQ